LSHNGCTNIISLFIDYGDFPRLYFHQQFNFTITFYQLMLFKNLILYIIIWCYSKTYY